MWQLPNGQGGVAASHLSRVLLSHLSRSTGFFLEPLTWSNRGAGQPKHPDMPPGWHASISHKQGRVVAALANCPIGIDLEIWQQRHTSRLKDLVQLLPETAIRCQIHQSPDTQRSFYKAYTLHEAMYKLAFADSRPIDGIFDTRIRDIRPNGHLFGWQWEDAEWTLSIVSTADMVSMESPLLIHSSDRRYGGPDPDAVSDDAVNSIAREFDLFDTGHLREIKLTAVYQPCYLFERFNESPAIRPLFVRPSAPHTSEGHQDA